MSGQAGKCDVEIEITPEMIEAGVSRLGEFCFGQPQEEIVEALYLAMEIERRFMAGPPPVLPIPLGR